MSTGTPDTAPDTDVTELVDFGGIDGEDLPLTKCVCGERFDYWDLTLHVYRDTAREMHCCGRKLYFRSTVQVLEVRT